MTWEILAHIPLFKKNQIYTGTYDLLCHYKEDNCVPFPLLQGPQGPPGSIGSVGGVGEKVRKVVIYSLKWQE